MISDMNKRWKNKFPHKSERFPNERIQRSLKNIYSANPSCPWWTDARNTQCRKRIDTILLTNLHMPDVDHINVSDDEMKNTFRKSAKKSTFSGIRLRDDSLVEKNWAHHLGRWCSMRRPGWPTGWPEGGHQEIKNQRHKKKERIFLEIIDRMMKHRKRGTCNWILGFRWDGQWTNKKWGKRLRDVVSKMRLDLK